VKATPTAAENHFPNSLQLMKAVGESDTKSGYKLHKAEL
jgi:hypothetical protein